MPDGKKYTVSSPEGKKITFTWNGEGDPTEKDLQEVFDQSKNFSPQNATDSPYGEGGPGYVQRVRRATLAPGATFNKAIGQIGEGNPVAGLANIANAGVGMIGAGLSPITEAPFVGSGLKNILGAVPWLADKAVGLGERAISATGIDPLANTMDARKRQEAADAMHQVNTNLAVAPVGKAIGNTLAAIPAKAGKLAASLESSAMKQSFSGEKGIIPFDRQAQTALQKYGYSPTRSGFDKVSSDLNVVNKNAKVIAARAEQQRGATIDLSEPRLQSFADAEIAKAKNSAAKGEITSAMEDVKSRVANVASQYPEGKVPLTAAIELKNSLQDMAEKFDTPTNDLTMKQLAYRNMSNQVLKDITTEEPLLRSIGRKQRDLIELKNTLARRVATQSRADILSWRMARAVAAGGGVGYVASGGSVGGALAGALAELALDNPSIKHWTAVTLQRISNLKKP